MHFIAITSRGSNNTHHPWAVPRAKQRLQLYIEVGGVVLD